MDKIPYDKEPIYRQNTPRKTRVDNRPNGGGRSRILSLVVCLLVIFNIVLSGLVINLVKKTKNNSGPTNNIFIETNGKIDVASVAEKTKASVVAVHAGVRSTVTYNSFFKMSSRGSGVIIQGNKDTGEFYILTCYHVVKGFTDQIYILLSDSHTPLKATLAYSNAYSKMYDLAVLKVQSDEYKRNSIQPCEIADSSLIRDGNAVVAYGNPQGAGLAVTDGLISKSICLIRVSGVYNRVMQTSAPINGGNSGGGLFNAEGKLIGIVNAKAGDDPSSGSYIDNIAYAIPSNVAIGLAKNILRYERPLKALTGLSFSVGSKNIVYDIVDGNLIPNQTVLVSAVESGSASDIAGFIAGDEVVSFTYNGNSVVMRNVYSFEDHAFNIARDEVVDFTVIRDNEEISIKVRIDSLVAADSQDWYNPN